MISAWALQDAAERGKLEIWCGRRGTATYELLSRDLLTRLAVIRPEPDPTAIWRMTLFPKAGISDAEKAQIPDCTSFRASAQQIHELWPKNDPMIDAMSEALLAKAEVQKLTANREMTFAEMVRHVAQRYPADQVEQKIRDALTIEEVVGVGRAYIKDGDGYEWEKGKSKIPPEFWNLAELEIAQIMSGHEITEICVVPTDRPDSFRDFERGVNFMHAGGTSIYKDITFKFDDVKSRWP